MKRLLGFALGALLVLGATAPQAAADILLPGENRILYNNFENLFSSTGAWLDPVTTVPAPGMHLAGLINVSGITVNGFPTFFSGPGGQLSGVFAQEIIGVSSDPITGALHLQFGNPAVSTFTRGGDSFSMGLTAGEMFRLYSQAPASTLFFSGGTMAATFAAATDGALFASFGLDTTNGAGLDGFFGTPDDTGYFYSHPVLGANPTGLAFGALNFVTSPATTIAVNDPNEIELGGSTLFTSLYLQSHFFLSQNRLGAGGTSAWDFESFDPAVVRVVPEPMSLGLLGMGFASLGLFGRKKLIG